MISVSSPCRSALCWNVPRLDAVVAPPAIAIHIERTRPIAAGVLLASRIVPMGIRVRRPELVVRDSVVKPKLLLDEVRVFLGIGHDLRISDRREDPFRG